MNRENLKKIADHILTIPQMKFDMDCYRFSPNDKESIKCNSIGCALGHSVELDPNPQDIPRNNNGDINFPKWSWEFTGLPAGEDEWSWCFHARWSIKDNTPKGVSERINWLLEKGLPKDWKEQLTEKKTNLCCI